MAPWEDDQSSSSSKEKQPYIVLRKVSQVRICSDTGGHRRNGDFEVAVLCLIFRKILFCFGTLYLVFSFCESVLCGTSSPSSIARTLRVFRGSYLNSFHVTRLKLKNKSKSKRHSKSIKFLALLIVIRILKGNTKLYTPIPILFFGRVKNYIHSTSIINILLYFRQISEPPLWMLHLHLISLKHLHFSSILFANNFLIWFMYYSSVVSKSKQGNFAPFATNKCLISTNRRKFAPNKFKYLTIGLNITDICFLWFSFIVDSGSRKWWIDQGLSKNLGALYIYSSSAYECDVRCGQYVYSVNKDRKHSLFNATKQATSVLFVTLFYPLLLWKGNVHQEDMGRIVTAKNHVVKNVRTSVAISLPLCLVMLV